MDIRETIELRQIKQLEAELSNTWMVRVLRATQREPIGRNVLSVIAHNFDGALLTLMQLAFPGFESLRPLGQLVTAAKIAKDGSVVADVQRNGYIEKDVRLYRNETALRDDFRRLADRMRLTDEDRIQMFKCVQRWVVADRRLDPTMDPQDPDAKRLH